MSLLRPHAASAAAAAAAAAKSLQSCLTLCDPIGGSPPGSAIPGILQARTLEWVAISFSNAWKWKVKRNSLSRLRLFATQWTAAHQAPPSMGFSREEYWSGVSLPSPWDLIQVLKKIQVLKIFYSSPIFLYLYKTIIWFWKTCQLVFTLVLNPEEKVQSLLEPRWTSCWAGCACKQPHTFKKIKDSAISDAWQA